MQNAGPRFAAAIRPFVLVLARFYLVGTQLIELGDHIPCYSPAGRRCPGIRFGGDVIGLLKRFAEVKDKARAPAGKDFSEYCHPRGWTGRLLDPRVLASKRIESHVVDPASTLASRRRRRANTDKDRHLRRKTTADRSWSTRRWLPRGSNTFSRIKRPLLAPRIFDYDLLPVTAGRGWSN